ncbi:CoA transferase [Saccharopolyspora sp. NPDC049426]|uniref:CoA transferase n=1 Tax=Saccharopolyspora sp. NPDC049426 TaxID=3155652 RepID=UPI0034464E15
MARPFDGLRVLDLSCSIAGQFAARLLADHGAAVRHLRQQAVDPGSAVFVHLNHNKIIDVLPVGGLVEALRRYGTGVDVIVVSGSAEAALARGVAPYALIATAPDFADEGPYRNWTGSELIHQALSGSMYYNGHAGQPPLYGVGDRASYAAGLFLYLSLVVRMRNRQPDTDGEIVQVAVHEAAAAMEQNFSAQWSYSKTIAQRGELNRPKARIRCADGWMMVFAMEGRLRELLTAVGAEDLADEPPFTSWQEFMGDLHNAFERVAERAKEKGAEDLLEAAVRYRLVMSPVRTPGELRDDSQLLARDFWREAEVEGRNQLVLGPMWRPLDYTPGPANRASEVAFRWVGGKTATDEASDRPLAGLRVIDFTTAWSGPLATRILAMLGAEVIKVESAERLDAWRGPAQGSTAQSVFYPDGRPGEQPYNRHAWFNAQNLEKKSVALNLKDPAGLAAARELCRDGDVVLTNFTPGTMQRLGLGFDELRACNPTITMVEMSGFGADGPLREHRAFGQTMEAMAGITAVIGYDASEPLGSGSAYVDPMGGLAGAAAALTALCHQERTGAAQYVEVAQREAAMHWIGEIILSAIATGTDPYPLGNARSGVVPHGAFRCRGQDEWIAIAVHTSAQWSALCSELGWSDWAGDPALTNLPGRLARSSEIEERLIAAAAQHHKAELAKRLQRAGVPAAPVLSGQDLFNDPQLRHRGWFTPLDHPAVGVREYAGLPVEIERRLVRPTSAAPLLGQHTGCL